MDKQIQFYEKYSDMETCGRFLMLSDGLSTWVLSCYQSQMIGKDVLEKYIKIDGYAKKSFVLFSEGSDKSSKKTIAAFCVWYEKFWKEMLTVLQQSDFLNDNISPNLFFDLKTRMEVFKSYGVSNYGYVFK